jgi:ADP-heptose:LPS heptosyltransferase
VEAIVFVGGLGDILEQIWNSDRYVRLSRLKGRAKVVVSCPNPGAIDLFRFHPAASSFDLVSVPFHGNWSPDVWKKYDVEEEAPASPRNQAERVLVHVGPDDLPVLEDLTKKPYLVFSLSAGTDDRNIPSEIAERAAELSAAAGFRVVTVGRTYTPAHHESVKPNAEVHRSETHLGQWPYVFDAIDRLSTPGSLVAIAAASGFFGCHSSMCLASWFVRKPTFVLLPKTLYGGFKVNDHYTFGRDYPENFHGEFSDWTPGFFGAFLQRLKKST